MMQVFFVSLLIANRAIISLSQFDSSLSTSFSFLNHQLDISYLDNTRLQGNICQDFISIGNLTYYGNFGCIAPLSEHNNFLFSGSSTGILGLGFPPNDDYMTLQTHFFEAWASSNPLFPSKVFTLLLDKTSRGGMLQLGGYDLTETEVSLDHAVRIPVLSECEDDVVSTKDLSESKHTSACRFRYFRIEINSIRLGISFVPYLLVPRFIHALLRRCFSLQQYK
jgi:hypothetical protein